MRTLTPFGALRGPTSQPLIGVITLMVDELLCDWCDKFLIELYGNMATSITPMSTTLAKPFYWIFFFFIEFFFQKCQKII